MTSPSPARAFDVRHLQLARALFAAVAAVMVTFSTDHSAPVGLSVFSGFAIATGLVFALGAWLAFPKGRRAPVVLLAVVTVLAGLVASAGRGTVFFFVVVIAWALVSGVIEATAALLARRAGRVDGAARDGLIVGALTVLLGVALAFTNSGYALEYFIEDAGRSFTLTGITIAVGLFGGYAAIVAVFLAIAGLSPRRPDTVPVASVEEPAS